MRNILSHNIVIFYFKLYLMKIIERRKLSDDEYPLVVRLIQGPHEDVSRLYLMESRSTDEISCDVAQFLNFSIPECKAILAGYDAEEEKYIVTIQAKYLINSFEHV